MFLNKSNFFVRFSNYLEQIPINELVDFEDQNPPHIFTKSYQNHNLFLNYRKCFKIISC